MTSRIALFKAVETLQMDHSSSFANIEEDLQIENPESNARAHGSCFFDQFIFKWRRSVKETYM